MAKIKIELVRGLAGKSDWVKRNAFSLGLKKPRQVVVHEKTPNIEGMINRIRHMVRVIGEE